jgi:hypothetical protein
MKKFCVFLAGILCAVVDFTASASTPSYWFSQLQVKPDAKQAQEFWFLPGTGMTFTYANNHVYLNSVGGTISLLSSNNVWTGNNNFTGPLLWNGVQVCTNCGGSGSFVLKAGDTMTGDLVMSDSAIQTATAIPGSTSLLVSNVNSVMKFTEQGLSLFNTFPGPFIYFKDTTSGLGANLSYNSSLGFWVDGNANGAFYVVSGINKYAGINSNSVHSGDGGLLTNITGTVGLSITQNAVLWSSTLTNQVAYTNVFANGLLIASGPYVSAHGSSLIQPAGLGYILQPGGGSLLLP